MRRILPGLLGLAMLCAACGSDEVEPFALVASSNGSIGLGEQRVLFGLVDPETDEFLASPDREATVTIRDENGSPLDTYPMEFIWTIPDVRGLYVAHVNIPEAATYQATIDAEGLATAGPAGFVAYDDPPVIEHGDEAPASETRTSAEFPDLSVISSDPEPDPAMYRIQRRFGRHFWRPVRDRLRHTCLLHIPGLWAPPRPGQVPATRLPGGGIRPCRDLRGSPGGHTRRPDGCPGHG